MNEINARPILSHYWHRAASMNIGIPNASTRNNDTQSSWYSWSTQANDTAVTGWDILTVSDVFPTTETTNSAYEDILLPVYTSAVDWGFKFLRSGFYVGTMTLDISNVLFTTGAQTMGFNLGTNGAIDARSPLFQARYPLASTTYSVELPIIGNFNTGDEIQPGQTTSTGANNEFSTGIIKIDLTRIRELA